MKKTLFILMALAAMACRKADIGITENCVYEIPATNNEHPKHDDYTQIIEKYRKAGLPGIAILMEDEDGIWVGSAGKADIERDIDFKLCHPSKAASITKMMVGTLTFILEEEGKLNLDDRIADYLDEKIIKRLKNADRATIRQCLQHKTGFYDIINDSRFYLDVLNHPNKNWTAEELIKYAYGKEVEFELDEGGAYSNTNTLLVSMVLDKVLGESHALALRNKIWNPLGMSDTYYQSREALPSHTAQGYYDLYNDGTIVNVSNLITGSGNGYGGVYSTVFDLHKFIKALYYEKTLISQQNLDRMMDFYYINDTISTGVGMLKRFEYFSPHAGIGHSGRDLGYSADLFLFPTKDDRLMIFFVNYGTDGNTQLREVFLDFEKELILKLLE